MWLGLVDVEPTRRSVNRLTPLPRVDDPIFVYLGVLSDRKTAVFLLPESVTASGDGRCQPSTSVCETIELQVGDKTRLTVAADNGDVLQYDLELLEVHRKGVSTRSTAQPAPRPAAATPKATAAAAEAVPDLGTDRYAYDKRTGLLRRRADAPTAETTVAGAPAPADGAPAALGDPLAPGLDALAAPAAVP